MYATCPECCHFLSVLWSKVNTAMSLACQTVIMNRTGEILHLRATPSPNAAIKSVSSCARGRMSDTGRTTRSHLRPGVKTVPGLIKENRRFIQKPCELTASVTLLWVKCCIYILMGCYRVINASVTMHYPTSELKGSLPNRLSLQEQVFFREFFMLVTCGYFGLHSPQQL